MPAIDVTGVDLSPRAPAEGSRLLSPRAKNWTRDTWLEIEIEMETPFLRIGKHCREWSGSMSWEKHVLQETVGLKAHDHL